MGISLNTNFDYKGPLPLDTRLVVESLAALETIDKNILYEGIICYCKLEKGYYSLQRNDSDQLEFTPLATSGVNKKGVDIFVLETQKEYDDLVANGVIDDTSKDLFFVLE